MIHPTSPQSSPFRGWLLFLCGVCMGTADLIPGISGGTVAFILGFYQPLLECLKSLNWSNIKLLLVGRGHEFLIQVQWKFLLTLISGIICAFVCFANLLHFILSNEFYRIYLYSVFFGLILASFVFCIRQVHVWNSKTVVGLCLGALIAFFLTESSLLVIDGEFSVRIFIETNGEPLLNYDPEESMLNGLSSQTLGLLMDQGLISASDLVYNKQHAVIGVAGKHAVTSRASFFNIWLIACGSIAVCALLLPGISGSYILTLLGVYPLVIEALVDFINGLPTFSFHYQAFAILASLGIGILFGAVLFARGVSWLLKKYPPMTMAILSGFMIGAIRSVWPFWSYVYAIVPLKLTKGPQLFPLDPYLPPLDTPLFWFALLSCAAGFIVVFGLEHIVQRKTQRV